MCEVSVGSFFGDWWSGAPGGWRLGSWVRRDDWYGCVSVSSVTSCVTEDYVVDAEVSCCKPEWESVVGIAVSASSVTSVDVLVLTHGHETVKKAECDVVGYGLLAGGK